MAVALVADDVIEFGADSLTLRPAGVPAIEIQGPDGRIGHLTPEQTRQLADLLTRAASMVDGLTVEAVEAVDNPPAGTLDALGQTRSGASFFCIRRATKVTLVAGVEVAAPARHPARQVRLPRGSGHGVQREA